MTFYNHRGLEFKKQKKIAKKKKKPCLFHTDIALIHCFSGCKSENTNLVSQGAI